MKSKLSLALALALFGLSITLSGCAGVRQEDLASWVGQPVSALEKHPIFLTMQLVRTVTSDGTEIRNYINATSLSRCSGGGSVFSSNMNFAAYNRLASCMSNVAACNNIFYVKDGLVIQYTAVGSGGISCKTDETLRPGFSGASNYR